MTLLDPKKLGAQSQYIACKIARLVSIEGLSWQHFAGEYSKYSKALSKRV